MRAGFYDALDSVQFGATLPTSARRSNTVAAAGVMMLEMVAFNRQIVLSQTQAFDGILPYMLGEESANATALRGLIADGVIRIGLVGKNEVVIPHQRPGQLTLLNAFTAALDDKKFVWSSWPEFHDPDVRSNLREHVMAGPDSLPTDPDLRRRLIGLRRLSSAASSNYSFVKESVLSLDQLVVSRMEHRAAVDPELRTVYAAFDKELAEAQRDYDDAGNRPANVREARSAWYSAIKKLRHRDELFAAGSASIERFVNNAYNRKVADSLLVPVPMLECGDGQDANAIDESQQREIDFPAQTPGDRITEVYSAGRGSRGLTWEEAAELRDDLQQVGPPEERLTILLRQHVDRFTPVDAEIRRGIRIAAHVASEAGDASSAAESVGIHVPKALTGIVTVAAYATRAVNAVIDEVQRRRVTSGLHDIATLRASQS